MASKQPKTLEILNSRIAACTACPRLIAYCRQVAREKKRAHREEAYWGLPVPSFGDPAARLLIVGLAPAAHGANRTGRMFTGDSSGDWLYEALHRHGFARLPTSTHRQDGQALTDVWITATNHCAPPDNKPSLEEQALCRPYLKQELELLDKLELVILLGKIAFDGFLRTQAERGFATPRPRPAFGHGVELSPWGPDGPALIGSFHPSRQNTNTGRLTRPMWHAIFKRARQRLGG